MLGGRKKAGGFPTPPGRPIASHVASDLVELTWEPPASAGGSGIVGYRLEVRSGGDGEFEVHTAHTADPEPRATLTGLLPMTWYEFRASAINGNAVGPPGEMSDPTLTRAAAADEFLGVGFDGVQAGASLSVGGTGASGRRRRTKQQGDAMLEAERATHAAMVKKEAGITLDIERSLASMTAWSKVFTVRHGRSPRDEDRQASRVLRDEAHTLRVLRHAHAEAALHTLDAERSVIVKEQAVARMAIKKWDKTHVALTGYEPSDADRFADPKYSLLLSRIEVAGGKLQRLARRRKRAVARLDAARVELEVAATDPDADAAMLDAAADAGRRGDGGGGDGRIQKRVERRWSQALQGGVAAREQQYMDLVMERATSRQLVDGLTGLNQAQLRRDVLVFSNADKDGDGILSAAEFRAHVDEGRRGASRISDIVFEALVKRADVDGNGMIDFNEWLLSRVERNQRADERSEPELGASRSYDEDLLADDELGPALAVPFSRDGRLGRASTVAADVGGGKAGVGGGKAGVGPTPSRTPLVLAESPRAVTPPPAEFELAEESRDGRASPHRAGSPPPSGSLVVHQPALGVPSEYLQTIIARSVSREIQDELSDPNDPEVLAAAVAFAAIDYDANGMLDLDEFEQLVVGTVMGSSANDDSTDRAKMKKMFDRADLNHDERIDFNEFLILRKRTLKHVAKQERYVARQEKKSPQKASAQRSRGDSRRRGSRGGESRRGGSEHSDYEEGPQVGEWVQAVRNEHRKEQERYEIAVKEHEEMVERRFTLSDALADLSDAELLVLEGEVLPGFPPQLSAAACSSALSMLGMRVGKMFEQEDIDRLVASLVPEDLIEQQAVGGGWVAKLTPAALVAGVKACKR